MKINPKFLDTFNLASARFQNMPTGIKAIELENDFSSFIPQKNCARIIGCLFQSFVFFNINDAT